LADKEEKKDLKDMQVKTHIVEGSISNKAVEIASSLSERALF
jgi:hypothetical protein